MERWKTKAI
jgi:hypothetical protein